MNYKELYEKYNNIRVERRTPFGDYEYVTLRIHHIRDYEEHGFPPHISWKVDNGNSWHFEGLTQFLDQTFEDFLKQNDMQKI
jgi:hypothetical protein